VVVDIDLEVDVGLDVDIGTVSSAKGDVIVAVVDVELGVGLDVEFGVGLDVELDVFIIGDVVAAVVTAFRPALLLGRLPSLRAAN